MSKNFTTSSKMDELFASLGNKTFKLSKGDQVTGEVIKITNHEIIIDLEGKSEGVISKKELIEDEYKDIKVGDTIKAYVLTSESVSGQTLLSLRNDFDQKNSKIKKSPFLAKKWAQLKGAMKSGNKLTGEVLEQNKGGFVVEVEGIRGFLPSSHISLKTISETKDLVGSSIPVTVIEADENNNRLVLSTRVELSAEELEKLKKLQIGSTVSGLVKGVFVFGALVDVDGLEGIVRTSDIAWERIEDPNTVLKTGDSIEAKILSLDEELQRLNLSIKDLKEDPLGNLAEKYQIDDVVSGTITEITQSGIKVSLKDGVEGLLSSNGTEYSVGQSANFLVAGVDTRKRIVNLAPFITSTAGLIYK